MASRALERNRGAEQAVGRANASLTRHDDFALVERSRHAIGVDRPGTAKGYHAVVGGRAAAFQHVHAGGGGHVFVDDAVDAPRRFFDRQSHRLGEMFVQGPPGGVLVEFHLAAEKAVGADIAQHQIGIGDGGQFAAAPIACRTRIGFRALRTDLRQAQPINGSDTAAASANLDHVDGGDLDRQSAAFLEAVDVSDLQHS